MGALDDHGKGLGPLTARPPEALVGLEVDGNGLGSHACIYACTKPASTPVPLARRRTPGSPMVSSTSPRGLNLKIWLPFPSATPASTIQTLSASSTMTPCGKTNMPAPKLWSSRPCGSNWRIGSTSESRHVFAPQRSKSQMLPRESTSIAWTSPSRARPASPRHSRPRGGPTKMAFRSRAGPRRYAARALRRKGSCASALGEEPLPVPGGAG